MVELTGGAHLARALKAEGITRVFGIPGTHNLEIFAQLSAHGIDIVSPRHEQGAGYMADGAARSTGEINVVVTTTGPAVLNALTALLQSFTDSVPVLLICPGMPLTHPGRGNGLLHEVRDQTAALRAVLTEVHRVTSPGEVSLAVGQTLTAMRAGRTRPAAIEIPLDLIEATGPGSLHPSIVRPLPTADPHAVDTAAEAVAESQRPLIIAGAGARSAGPALLELAETLGAGIILSSNAKGIIDDSEPLCLGAVGVLDSLPELFAGADAVIAIGTELAPSDFWPEPLPLPRDGRAHRHRRSPDAHERPGDPPDPRRRERRRPTLVMCSGRAGPTTTRAAADWAEQKKAAATSAAEVSGRPWADLCGALNSFTASADSPVIVAADSTMACYYGVQTGWSARAGDRFLYPAGAGTLGYGLPAGIGAKLAAASARVIAIEGDGGSMFTIAELAAAVQAKVQVTLIIVDNGGYGEIRNEMADRGDEPSGVVLSRSFRV
jgi:thiamine pyrophosphate-dependent acetolactate synthase large subunit-like protein